MNDCKAVAILIDNSATSMDGDFNQNRLDAQIQTVSRYSQHLFDKKNNSQVAIGTLSTNEFGIRVSFTTSVQRVESCYQGISSTGTLDLVKGIKCAVLALRHCKNPNPNTSESDIIDADQDLSVQSQTEFRGKKRILAFVGSQNDLDMNNYHDLIDVLLKEQVGIDLIEIGESVPNSEILKRFIDELNQKEREKPDCILSNYLPIPKSKTMLSDDVISQLELQNQSDDFGNDLEYQEAVKLSQQSNSIHSNSEVTPVSSKKLERRKSKKTKSAPTPPPSTKSISYQMPVNQIPTQPINMYPHSSSPQQAVQYLYPIPNQSPYQIQQMQMGSMMQMIQPNIQPSSTQIQMIIPPPGASYQIQNRQSQPTSYIAYQVPMPQNMIIAQTQQQQIPQPISQPMPTPLPPSIPSPIPTPIQPTILPPQQLPIPEPTKQKSKKKKANSQPKRPNKK